MTMSCTDCGWKGGVLGDRETDDGFVECCPMCDSDDIEHLRPDEPDEHTRDLFATDSEGGSPD